MFREEAKDLGEFADPGSEDAEGAVGRLGRTGGLGFGSDWRVYREGSIWR